MKIYIDGDSFPFLTSIIDVIDSYEISCVLVHNFNQQRNISSLNCETIVVDNEKNSADYKIFSMINKLDIVLTNDKRFALLCDAKGAIVLNRSGVIYKGYISYYKPYKDSNKKKSNKITEKTKENFLTVLKYVISEVAGEKQELNYGKHKI